MRSVNAQRNTRPKPLVWLGIAVIFTSLAATSCAGCEEQRRQDTQTQVDPSALAEGAALYEQYCSLCHGDNGQGYAADHANALNNPNFLKVATDEFLREAIAQGRPGTPMSAWSRRRGGPLSGSDIHKLVVLIRSWQSGGAADVHGEQVQGDVTRGRGWFVEHCQSCHGDDGSGVTAVSLNNPRFLKTASNGYIRYSIAQGRPGTPMPAFAEQLEASAIDDLVALIRSWERPITDLPGGDVPTQFDEVIIHPRGDAPQFNLREDRYVSALQVKEALEVGQRMILLDARATSDWLEGHIPGAVPVPFYNMDPFINQLPQDGTWIVAYCGCPHAASGRVVDTLRERGFPRTAVLDEGIHVWQERGYPMATGSERGTFPTTAAEEPAESPVPATPE